MLSLRQRLASSLLAALGSATMLAAIAGCANHKTPAYIGYPNLQNVGLTQVWERRIVLAPGEHFANAWRVGDSVYVTSDKGRVARIQAASGVKSWDVSVGAGTSQFHRPFEMSDARRVIIASRGEVDVVNKATGATEASSRLNFLINTDPVVIGKTLCLGGNDDFYGLFLDQLGGRVWVTVAPNDGFRADPAVIGKDLVLASAGGKLWRVNGEDGNWTWKDRKVNGDVTAGVATDGKVVYVASLDHYLYAFDATSGGQLWDARLDGTLDHKPVLAKGLILVVASDKGLYAVNPADGQVKWEADGVAQVASVVGDRVWVGDKSGNLKALSLADGTEQSSTPIPAAATFVQSPDNWIIMMNKAGVLEGYKAQ